MTSPLTFIGALFASALCVLTMVAETAEPPATIPSAPMEAALDALRSRFSNQVVIGFEELWEVRPQREPQIDLGPGNSTLPYRRLLGQALARLAVLYSSVLSVQSTRLLWDYVMQPYVTELTPKVPFAVNFEFPDHTPVTPIQVRLLRQHRPSPL